MALDLSGPLDILALSLAISSSAVAILSGRWLQEHYRRKNEEKQIRSALVSYLAGLWSQIVPIGSMFFGISNTGMRPIPPGDYPLLVDAFIQSETDLLIQCSPIDSLYYEKNVKDKLLYLPEILARQAVAVAILVANLNNYLQILTRDISAETQIAKGGARPARIITTYISCHAKSHRLISELCTGVTDLVQRLTSDMLEGEVKSLNFQALLDKMKEINATHHDEENTFARTLFPDWKDQPPVSTSEKK